MDAILKENERIDDLERNGYRIIQNSRKFCFGMDAVLLCGFVREAEQNREWNRIADLGTGTGIIPLLLHGRLVGKEKIPSGKQIVGLEIQPDMQEMASRSVCLNGLEEEIRILQGDIKEAAALLGRGRFEVVTSNPPYMKQGGGIANPESSKAISRHEVLCTFEDVAAQAAALLVPGGRFYLVHRPERLAELMEVLRKCRLEPKRLRMVHSFADADATMVLIEAARGGGAFLKVEKPLIIYKDRNVYTDEILEIYYY